MSTQTTKTHQWFLTIFLYICLLSISSVTSCQVTVTIEAPSVQRSTAKFDYRGEENFDTLPEGFYPTFTTNFGLGPNSTIQGTYYNMTVKHRDIYGGADGNGSYVAATSAQSYSLYLTEDGRMGVNYFGMWISALDANNRLEFYFQDNLVYSRDSTDIAALIKGHTKYYGNPTYDTATWTQEPYAFLNFSFSCLIDQVHFVQMPGSNAVFETDRHTVGYILESSGEVVRVETTDTTQDRPKFVVDPVDPVESVPEVAPVVPVESEVEVVVTPIDKPTVQLVEERVVPTPEPTTHTTTAKTTTKTANPTPTIVGATLGASAGFVALVASAFYSIRYCGGTPTVETVGEYGNTSMNIDDIEREVRAFGREEDFQ